MQKKLSPAEHLPVPSPFIERRILRLRSQNVLLDRDLAELYGVKAIALRQQVKRNLQRFPPDFMFQLTTEEADILVSQNVIPDRRSMGGSLPYVFTQEGVAMLSSVLTSARAVQMNILIMRAFVKLREFLLTNKDLAGKIEQLDAKQKHHGNVIAVVAQEIQNLGKYVKKELKKLKSPRRRKPRIGFYTGDQK